MTGRVLKSFRIRLLALPGLAAILLVQLGCASAGRAKSDAATNVASSPTISGDTTLPAPATQPSGSQLLRLADAQPINTAADAQPSLNLQNKITEGGQTVYFGQLETYDGDDLTASIPVIARRDGQRILGLPVRSDAKSNEAWAYVGAGPGGAEMWAIVDANIDDKTSDLLLVHSVDNGRTFTVTYLRKPQPAAQFDSFAMDRDGIGRVSVYLARSDAGRRGAGYYHYRTRDAGRTWTLAEYEHDSMQPADDVPDSDQPSGVMRVLQVPR
jgi:hypothetical protein